MQTYNDFKVELNKNIDVKYKAFNDPIVKSEYPTSGVRTPVIKKAAKSVPLSARDVILNEFFADNVKTFESVMFAGCLAARKKDYAVTREYLKRIIPLFGSWAHVDCVVPLLDWVDKDTFLRDFRYLLESDRQYEVRTYIIYLFECLEPERINFVLDTLKEINYGAYYVDMAAAWLLAECFVKFYDKTLPLFVTPTFPKFVHNKALQKARESFRITPETKEYLNTLKIRD